MNTVLILAPTASSFQRIAGLPLVQRTVLSALRCDFDRLVVVGGARAAQVRALLKADDRTRAVEVTESVPAIEGARVTVIPSDCVVTAATLERVNAWPLDGRPVLFTSSAHGGIAVCRPAMLKDLAADAVSAGDAATLRTALRTGGPETVALDGEVCMPISDARSVDAAEAALCARLRADSAESDGPLAHWIDRRISLRISRWLVAHTRLRPNHITVIGTSVGLVAAALLAVGGYWTSVAGTLLFLCATIIDGCDGEVARFTFRESAFGQKFDVITDNVVHVAIFVGLAIGLYHENPGGHYFWLMGILLGGFACDSVVTYFFLVRRPGFARNAAPVSRKGKIRQRLLRGMEALMNRDFAYLLAALAVCDRLYWFFWGTAFGTYAFAIVLVWVYRWRDAA